MKNIWRRTKPLDMSDANIGIDDMPTSDEKMLVEYFRSLPECDKQALIAIISRNKYYNELNRRNAEARDAHAAAYKTTNND